MLYDFYSLWQCLIPCWNLCIGMYTVLLACSYTTVLQPACKTVQGHCKNHALKVINEFIHAWSHDRLSVAVTIDLPN